MRPSPRKGPAILLDPALLAVVAVVYLSAGTVKGLSGIGLPAMAVAATSQIVDTRTAVALVIFPMIVSNAWQVFRSGDLAATLRRYAVFGAILAAGVLPVTVLAATVEERAMQAGLGVIIIVFATVSGIGRMPPIPDRLDRRAQVAGGLAAALFGGLSAVWGPPIAMYLAARGVEKDEFVRASGVLILIGSVPLCIGYAQQGLLTGPLSLTSGLMILPTLAGFALGERLRRRVSAAGFRRVLLWIFLFLGLNLVRRGLF